MAKTTWTRRQVIQAGAVGAAGLIVPARSRAQGVLGANDRIRMAVIGINGRGKSHINAFAGMKDVDVVSLADPDSRLFASRIDMVEKKGGNRPKVVQDFRKVLEDKSIDAVSIATPNYWHSLMTIWACQAGKDVYVEKPMSHNVHEGRIAVEAARKYNRIVQHGTQNRSDAGWRQAIAAIRSGKYGKLHVARGLCYKTRPSIGFKEIKKPPAELDFNLWLGPAQEQGYHENLVHYNWHWFWDFGNGDIGNQGVHQMDVARWGIAGSDLHKSVISLGGRFGYEDQGETPNTQMAVFDYGDTQLIFEVRRVRPDSYFGVDVGTIFHLEAGTIVERKFFPRGSSSAEPLPEVDWELGPGKGPFRNFIEAVRSKKQSDLNAPLLEGHYSSTLCHLANVSYRLGEEVPFNKKTETFGDNRAAYGTFARLEEHIGHDYGFNLDGMKYRLGRQLAFDPTSETFVNDAEANKMLTRNYRAPFTLPDKV